MEDTSQQVILIVSADRTMAKAYHAYLQQAGYKVYETCEGSSATQLLQQLNPQLALFDWALPDINVLAITRTIRSSPRFAQLPIILTGKEIGWQDRILSLEAGVDLCLDGVIYPKELVARVRALLRRVNVDSQQFTVGS